MEWHIIHLFGVIVWVKVVLRKTVVGDRHFDYLKGTCSHLQSLDSLTLKMTTTQVVKPSVTNNSLSKLDYLHPDDHAKQITDTPGFKPFTMEWHIVAMHSVHMYAILLLSINVISMCCVFLCMYMYLYEVWSMYLCMYICMYCMYCMYVCVCVFIVFINFVFINN